MNENGQDIVRATDSEFTLTGDRLLNWICRFLGLMLAVAAVMPAVDAYNESDYFSEATGGYLLALAGLTAAVAVWQLFDRRTTIRFNQPPGSLTVERSPWWSILIPGGPRLKRRPTRVPLPKSAPVVRDSSGLVIYGVQTGPDTAEIRQSHINRYDVEIPLAGGRVYHLWTTGDRNTCVEIIRRIDRAIQESRQDLRAGARDGAAMDGAARQAQALSFEPQPGPRAQAAAPFMAKCPRCGRPAPAGTRFCPYDGTPIVQVCPGCGNPASPVARFCPRCGVAIVTER